MDSMEEIAVLNREARRRGISYGKLVAVLSWEDRQRLIQEAERAGAGKKARKKVGGA